MAEENNDLNINRTGGTKLIKTLPFYGTSLSPYFAITEEPIEFSRQNVGNVNDIFKSVTLLKTDRQNVHLL
jgi:hypothetical protein